MRRARVVGFAKAHGYGNDFLLVDRSQKALKDLDVPAMGELARHMCHRLHGVGADGLISYTVEKNEITMRLANSDGSDAAISGNGVRCLAAYLCYKSGDLAPTSLEIDTPAGRVSLELVNHDGERFEFCANMGQPRLGSQDVPLMLDSPLPAVVSQPLVFSGRSVEVTALSMGNPHCVVFCDRLDLELLRELGPVIENDARFPERTNLELVEVTSRNELRMAVWERGAGETASSGTGSSASAVAALLNQLVESPVTVHCAGGASTVEWTPGDDLYLTGEASVIAEGSFFQEWEHET